MGIPITYTYRYDFIYEINVCEGNCRNKIENMFLDMFLLDVQIWVGYPYVY